MLTRENEGGRVRCHKYWPEKGANNYSTLQVIHHSEVEYPDYIMRDLKLVDIKVCKNNMYHHKQKSLIEYMHHNSYMNIDILLSIIVT